MLDNAIDVSGRVTQCYSDEGIHVNNTPRYKINISLSEHGASEYLAEYVHFRSEIIGSVDVKKLSTRRDTSLTLKCSRII